MAAWNLESADCPLVDEFNFLNSFPFDLPLRLWSYNPMWFLIAHLTTEAFPSPGQSPQNRYNPSIVDYPYKGVK